MSDNNQNPKEESADDVLIDLGGKSVPLLKINKPHHVLDPRQHKPVIDPKDFPSVEGTAVLTPLQHKPVIDAKDFPPLEKDK